jgi:hypothetical protein
MPYGDGAEPRHRQRGNIDKRGAYLEDFGRILLLSGVSPRMGCLIMGPSDESSKLTAIIAMWRSSQCIPG